MGKDVPATTDEKEAQSIARTGEPSSLDVRTARKRMLEELRAQAGSDEEAMERIIDDIHNASSVDDVLGGPGTVDAEQLLTWPLRLEGYKVSLSAKFKASDGGKAPFALIDAIHMETGERFLVTCGGEKVLAQLLRLKQLKAFPVTARFMSKDTGHEEGRTVLSLEAVPGGSYEAKGGRI